MDFRDRGSDLGIEKVEFRTTVPVEWNAYAADAVKIGHRVADVPRTASMNGRSTDRPKPEVERIITDDQAPSMKGGEYSPPNYIKALSTSGAATVLQ